MEKHKYPYGIIGNCGYIGLIDTHANVGWLCWPRFDSSFVFGTLLDDEKGGGFSISPEKGVVNTVQQYIPNTNVLETTITAEDGTYKVIDFAPRFINHERQYKPLMLVRKIIPIKGTPRIQVACNPVGDYGETIPTKVFGSSHIRYEGLSEPLRLTTNISLNYVDNEQAFVLKETKHIILTCGAPLEGPLEETAEMFLRKTVSYWRNWIMTTSTENFHQEAVIRSALTLKLHEYQDTGAIIAATTTSLPEFPGSTRNWDYRFCWIRDTHYTIKALNELSHFSITERYAEFIQNIVLNKEGRYHPLYPITMDRIPEEKILPLKGYRGEKPVRIGNQAFEHIQNDAYGQVLVTLLPLFTDKRLASNAPSSNLLEVTKTCLDMIDKTMDEGDNGLWEFRGTSQKHSYTYLFHWAGSHAAKKIGKIIGDHAMIRKANRLIKASAAMLEACYDAERGVYTQAVGSPNLDASLLLLINMGYLNPRSAKAKKHLAVLEKELRTESGLFYRYVHVDDFGAPESTFLICAFWYVEALARMGRLKEAIEIFERLVKHGNHLGLLSEDVHEKSGSQWGNFPQTYSHVGLINAAFTISRKLDQPVYF